MNTSHRREKIKKEMFGEEKMNERVRKELKTFSNA
jgi:hypothetical protein